MSIHRASPGGTGDKLNSPDHHVPSVVPPPLKLIW
jgi:hypothetical protein